MANSMAKNINSAFRIREILIKVNAKNNNQKVNEVWAELFNIEETEPMKMNAILSRLLSDLHDEVELIREEMSRLDFSSELYNSTLDKCNLVFVSHFLMTNWQSPQQNITPEVINALGFCSEIIESEESLVDEASIDELQEIADNLRASLKKSILPNQAKKTIERHLVKIEEAITAYKIIGIKGFGDVLQSACGELVTNELLHDDEILKSKEIGLLKKGWQKSKEIMDGVVTADKRIGAIGKFAEKGSELIEYIGNVL